jgi:hypothetical protein
VLQLLVTANLLPVSLILLILIMEATGSSETLVLQEPHAATLQKTAFFIVTAVKTSNVTRWHEIREMYSLAKLELCEIQEG